MDPRRKKTLEAAGFMVGDVDEFLGLSPDEMQMVELRVKLIRAVRELRERQGITQKQLANRMKSSQPRIAKMEANDMGVSLDLMFRGYFALGGRLDDLTAGHGKRMLARKRKTESVG
jgi:predicted XRE-type DNA-binding protein